MKLTISEAQQLIERGMRAAGHDAAEATIIADHLIDCELRGLSFGGLPRALSVLERLESSKAERSPIRVVKESPISAAIDGGDQVGYLVARRATDMAIEKAKATGIAVVTAKNTWYTGMFSYYLEMLTAAGFVGMIAGNGAPRVAPFGGTESRFSTNPMAFGFPSKDKPVIWDIGTSAVMLGEVVLKQRLGEPLAEGLAFDPQGQPTRDPNAAMEGAFAVWGGHKGSGLALVVQLLGMMSGAVPETRLRDCGFFLFAVNPDLFTSSEEYEQRVAEFSDFMRQTRPLDPSRPVRVPFERSIVERQQRLAANSVSVDDTIFQALTRFAEQNVS